MFDFLRSKLSAPDLLSDTLLVRKIKRGDREAFGKLYMKYVDQIYRYIYFRVDSNQQEAEDLAEVVFFKAWDKIKMFDHNGGSFKAWMYKIAHNTVIDHYRQSNRVVSLDDSVADERVNMEEKLSTTLDVERIQTALRHLTDVQKQVVTLRFIDGLSIEETADVMGKNEESVRALTYRALKQLRGILNNSKGMDSGLSPE